MLFAVVVIEELSLTSAMMFADKILDDSGQSRLVSTS
jgi:hypothetical protein